MGLYYQAILSSLLLNFLPDLPTTSFFTPQSPILFFFSLWLLLFSLCFFHITAEYQPVKKKKNWLLCLCQGNLLFLFYFFSHKKSPFFVRTVVQNWQKLTTIPKMVTSTPCPKRESTKKWQPLAFIAGALTVVSNSLWRMACPHLIDLSPSKRIEPHRCHPK